MRGGNRLADADEQQPVSIIDERKSLTVVDERLAITVVDFSESNSNDE